MNSKADLKDTHDLNDYKEFLDSLPEIIFEVDCSGRFIYFNKSTLVITGYTADELYGQTNLDFVVPEDREEVLAGMQRIMRGESTRRGECRLVKKDGTLMHVTIHCRQVIKNGVLTGIRGILIDITEKKQMEDRYLSTIEELAASRELLEQNQENYRMLFDIANGPIYTVDPDLTIRSANKGLCEVAGLIQDEIVGRSVDAIPELSVNERKWSEIISEMKNKPESMEFETHVNRRSGESSYYNVSLSPILDRERNFDGILGINHDITRIKQNEEEIRHLAYYDGLTDLPNRLMLEKRIDELVSYCQRGGQKFGILFLDLDNFKKVNDTLGHHTGDALLVEVGKRLQSGARKYDIISRIGGDEFAIVLLDIKKPRNIGRFAERLLKLFDEPFMVDGHTIYVSPSIGITLYPEDGLTTDDMMQNVDTAMYKAKTNGKNNYQFFNNIMKEEITRKVNIEKYLRRALQNDEFILNYQPLINSRTGKIRGFEALIRWTCPEIGNVPPSDFIPIAEECGLIIPIGEWVLRTACMRKKRWETEYNSRVIISVNISALQFKQDDFVGKVRSILTQTGLDPKYLELEITESILINCLDNIVKKLHDLRKMGVRISLDDFGTGYSSLNYLRILPLDTLKIDKSFTHCINNRTKDHHFVKSIVSLVQKYDLDIVAEGVETPEQLDYLAKCRCNYVQGYLVGRPVTELDTLSILHSGRIDIKKFSVLS